MSIDIFNLIKERRDYPIGRGNDFEFDYIADKLDNSQDIIGLIVPDKFVLSGGSNMKILKDMIFDKWYISAIFDLSSMWKPYTMVKFVLLVLSRDKFSEVLFSQYEGKQTTRSIDKQIPRESGFIGELELDDEYQKYIKCLEECLRDRQSFKSIKNAKTYKTNYSQLNLEKLNLNYYEPELVRNYEYLKNEKTKVLSELADLLIPRKEPNSNGHCFKPSNFNYPINYSELSSGEVTDVKLKKGDILIYQLVHSSENELYLVHEETKVDLFASQRCIVIRPKLEEINSEYLFLYLKSDTTEKYFLRDRQRSGIRNLSKKEFEKFPVIIPKAELLSRSEILFDRLYLKKNENAVEVINRELFKKNEMFEDKSFQKEFIEELLHDLKVCKKDIIDKLLTEDLKELDSCYNNENYKSCLVLCGSILEAILLDWLSEIERRDYYSSQEGISLYNMIDKLFKLRYFDKYETRQAHLIRDKRNLIHPKKYLNSKDSIDKKSCSEVLDSLRLVLKKRGLGS